MPVCPRCHWGEVPGRSPREKSACTSRSAGGCGWHVLRSASKVPHKSISILAVIAAVSPKPCAGADTHHVPGDYNTIQACINAAQTGDECIVAPGTYGERISFLGKALMLRSIGGAAVTIIDGTGLNGSVITCDHGEAASAILDGFTITGGNGFSGGGMYIYYSSPTVTNCAFSKNSTTGSGRGIYNQNSSPTVVACTFNDNIALQYGGEIYNASSSPQRTNCTFSANVALYYGGALYSSSGTPKVTNCILWRNHPDQVYGNPTISYSDIEGGWIGVGNIDADPAFLGAYRGDLRLMSGSPCIDAGDNVAVPFGITTDLDGNIRRVDDPCASNTGHGPGPVVDMGAFELSVPQGCGNGVCSPGESCEVCTCDCGNCCGDGVCAVHENCLSCAADCTCPTLHVPGDYDLIQEAIAAANSGDAIIIGPGRYNEAIDFLGKAITVRSSDGPANTTIDATGLNKSVVTCRLGEGPESVLSGFTITGGKASFGSGMYNSISSPTATNCVFVQNLSTNGGGGMYNSRSNPAVTDCKFIRNSGGNGGAIYNNYSNPTITNCAFARNESSFEGGGIANNYGNPTVTNCTFFGNTAKDFGGGMSNAGGISVPTVANCILWGNHPDQITNHPVIRYCEIEGGWNGVGNIDADPLFANENGSDLRSRSGSPCIDAGDNAAVPAGVTTDMDGNVRRVDDPCASNTGHGRGAVVDMGAFELCVPQGCGNGVCSPGESCEVCTCDCGKCCGDGVCAVHENCQTCAADCFCSILRVPGDYGVIQDAIQAARDGDEIVVGAGRYCEAIDFLGKAITVRSSDGPSVTTIDATGLNTSVVTCWSGEGPGSVLEGFLITGGNGFWGGGMGNNYSSPTITNCTFGGNNAYIGGGMSNSYSSPTVTDCTFSRNTSSTGGGGVFNEAYSNPAMTGCTFIENTVS